MITQSFASDNSSGIHSKVIDAICRANHGHVLAYGQDKFTEAADSSCHSANVRSPRAAKFPGCDVNDAPRDWHALNFCGDKLF